MFTAPDLPQIFCPSIDCCELETFRSSEAGKTFLSVLSLSPHPRPFSQGEKGDKFSEEIEGQGFPNSPCGGFDLLHSDEWHVAHSRCSDMQAIDLSILIPCEPGNVSLHIKVVLI